ncbi:hypothetical protein O6H91_09G011500 [Diphasiastrum complanatum]|uniref:Uncharacterized protein n=1 Tax=Diphasiastrum complanatum TaxID=34168 RepID=A0ACC2CLA3_DIPCM|nr:hypothetical protein O6H91_09G011500 [Diphasiastrum complanatum]
MSGRDRETEGRFLHLLQPNRDLAANWSVDVAQELEGYLAEISLTTLFEDGQNSLNFAEAALLIQGSIQIYSRKVEYLYALVLQALDVIGNKKQAQLETSSIQGDGKDADVEQEEEEFLNLDDVPEEPNIDIENEGSGGYITPVVKPPSSLLVVEGDALHAAGDVGELETYQIATSSLHRDFLLLDPCDAETVDIYLNTTRFSKRSARRTPRHLSSASRSKTQKSNFSTPGRRASSAKKAEASEAFRIDVQDPIQAFDSVGGRWEDLSGEDHVRNIDFEDPDLDGNSEDNHENNAFHGEKEEDEDDDPWAPLNPHDLGTLPIKPFKKGQLYRKQKLKDHYLSGEEVEFPLASRNGVTLPEFAEAWHKRQADARRRQTAAGDSATLYEKLRSSFQNSDEDLQKDSLDGSGVSQDNSWDNCEHSDEDYDAPQLFESSLPFDQPEKLLKCMPKWKIQNKKYVDQHGTIQMGKENQRNPSARRTMLQTMIYSCQLNGWTKNAMRAYHPPTKNNAPIEFCYLRIIPQKQSLWILATRGIITGRRKWPLKIFAVLTWIECCRNWQSLKLEQS